MKSVFFSISVLFIAALQTPAYATTLADDLVGELYQMKSVYSAEYAPASWKASYANYSLDAQFKIALDAVQSKQNLTPRDAREILKNFIYSMKDYHTSISFVSTETATLPFSVKGTGDRFFIMYIDRTKLSEAAFPFQVGDELVTFDGRPTAQAVALVQAQTPANVSTTDKALAEIYLTKRSGARGLDVPQGPITIGVKEKKSNTVMNFELVWDYTAEKISPRQALIEAPVDNLGLIPEADFADELSPKASSIFRPVMNVKMDTKLGDAPATPTPAPNPYDLGGRQAFTPDLGTKIWTSSDTDIFYAYIFKAPDGKLYGYLRLPQFEVPKDDYVAAVAEFSRDVSLFDSVTEAMVIDQVNNPGGSVFYMYALDSLLATQPMTTPLHRMAITQSDVSDALKQIALLAPVKTDADAQKVIPIADSNGYPVGYEFAKFTLEYSHFIVNQWNMGHKLTSPYWIAGVDHVNPADKHYTKPILLLINHLDFSGGDFFPATLQDNKRVVVMGSRTAGAGGYVVDVPVSNNVGVAAYRCTESIAERVSKNPIENLGVTPDVPYEMTVSDFQNNYGDYVKAVQTELTSLATK